MKRQALYSFMLTGGGVALPIALLIAGLWFSPNGTGEYLKSPNGKFTASAMNMNKGTWKGTREQYINIYVVEHSTGHKMWEVNFRHSTKADMPDFGIRGKRFIVWKSDSSSVSIPISRMQKLELPVSR
jgi:hypothetical protein